MTGSPKLQVRYTVWIKNVTSKYPHPKHYFSKKNFFFVLPVEMFMHHGMVGGTCRGQKRALEPRGLELQISVSPEVDGGK